LVEEPEETAIVIIQVVDQLIGVSGTGRIRCRAIPGIASGVVPQQRCSAEHEQRRIVHEVQHGQQSESDAIYKIKTGIKYWLNFIYYIFQK